MRHRIFLVLIVLVISHPFPVAQADTIYPALDVVAEDYYPQTYMDNGKVSGTLVDIIESISYSAGMPVTRDQIRILPWSEAYISAQQIPGTLLLGVYRTPDREPLFKWIGPVETDPNVFFVKPGTDVVTKSFKDIKNLKIGVIAGDAHYQLLILYGIPSEQIFTTHNGADLIRMVLNGNIDTFYYGEQAGKALATRVTGSPDAIKAGLKFGVSETWFAMSTGTPDSTVNALQYALNTMHHT